MNEKTEKLIAIQNYINFLLKEREVHAIELNKIDKAILSVRETCEHSYIYIGHDSHGDMRMCEICKKEIID